MSETKKEYWPHPLLPVFRSLALNTKPLTPFAPQTDFAVELELAALRFKELGEDEVKQNALTTYRYSAIAAYALSAAGGSDMEGEDLHAMMFVAAQGSWIAHSFCDAAGYAFRLGMFPSFAVATRLPGFMDALELWGKYFEYDQRFNGPEHLKYVIRNLVENNAPDSRFWQNTCGKRFPSLKDFNQALAKEVINHTKAKSKKESRGTSRERARFKDAIALYWIPASLWARSAKSILSLLDPKADDGVNALKRIDRDISEIGKPKKLGFAASHNGSLEQFIDKIDERGAKKLLFVTR